MAVTTDPETGEGEYKEVVRAFRRESDVIIHVFVNGEEIETTPNHPFWVENQWVLAKDLREGDVLTLADGTTATITRTYGEQLDEPVIVYNFEVQDFHTYYVTDTGVLVHNANKYVNDGNSVHTDTSNAENNSDVEWNNGWRTSDGKFAIPNGNGQAGALAEQETWEAVASKDGWKVREGRIYTKNDLGQIRVYDGVAISPNNHYIGLEVKSGSARRSRAQRIFDSMVSKSNPAIGIGQNADIIISHVVLIRK